MKNKGVSMITLIITIIVVIILAAIAMILSGNPQQKARVAKFKSEFSDFRLLVSKEYEETKGEIATFSKRLQTNQIYYMIAKNKKYSEMEGKPAVPDGRVGELTIEILGVPLAGDEYYEITSDLNITGMEEQKKWYFDTEKHYVTDEGIPFVLPGFLEQDDGVNKWWINENSYYIGEGGKIENPEEEPSETPDVNEPETPETPETPEIPETPETPENPGDETTGTGTPNKFTIAGIDIEILGDLMEIEIPEDKNGVQVWPGSVIAYEGDFYAAKYEDYIDKNQRESFITRSAVKLNVDQGALVPGPDTVEGDIKLEGEDLYAFRPWGAVGNYEFWTDANLWLKLLKKPVIDFR